MGSRSQRGTGRPLKRDMASSELAGDQQLCEMLLLMDCKSAFDL